MTKKPSSGLLLQLGGNRHLTIEMVLQTRTHDIRLSNYIMFKALDILPYYVSFC